MGATRRSVLFETGDLGRLEEGLGRGRGRTVDPAEHAAHLLEVTVIEEPDAGIVLVLLEGDCGSGWWGGEGTGRGSERVEGPSERRDLREPRASTTRPWSRARSSGGGHRRTYPRRSWSRRDDPCGARPAARRPRACSRSHPVSWGVREESASVIVVRGRRRAAGVAPSLDRGAPPPRVCSDRPRTAAPAGAPPPPRSSPWSRSPPWRSRPSRVPSPRSGWIPLLASTDGRFGGNLDARRCVTLRFVSGSNARPPDSWRATWRRRVTL